MLRRRRELATAPACQFRGSQRRGFVGFPVLLNLLQCNLHVSHVLEAPLGIFPAADNTSQVCLRLRRAKVVLIRLRVQFAEKPKLAVIRMRPSNVVLRTVGRRPLTAA